MGALLGIFFQLQLLVAVAALLAAGLRLCGRAELFTLSAHTELRLQYFLVIALGCALLLPWLVPDFSSPVRPFARVVHTGAVSAQAIGGTPSLVLGTVTKNSTGLGLGLLGWLAAAEVLLGLFHTLLDYLRLLRVISRAVVFRKLGRVRIAVLDGISTPFSARLFHFAWVVLPANSLGKSTLRLALAHELQHHRAGDTVFCHLLAPLRVLCYLHPLRPLWCSVLAEIQELACDEALVSSQTKKWISVRNYSECLVHAAETAVKEKAGRAYAAAPALFSDRRLLKRRIEKMRQQTTTTSDRQHRKTSQRWLGYALGLGLGCCLAASAGATNGLLVDSRITMEDAERMAETARKGSDFPVAVNAKVLRYLQYYLGTAKGREVLRVALANLEALRPRFEQKLAKYHAPEELLAVGLIESAFKNLPSSANSSSGAAGIWQFIASTARVFGLRVDNTVDERLDIDLEADAAFRYLLANKMRFNDWLLGVMAYNMGERALDDAISKAGTRDPWELVKRGFENDSDYLPKFMAAVLILKNPQALK